MFLLFFVKFDNGFVFLFFKNGKCCVIIIFVCCVDVCYIVINKVSVIDIGWCSK